jgi:hypothetical protein
MPKHILKILFSITTYTFVTAHSWAHVPYLENIDFSTKQPFTVEYSIEQSLAIYAWLEKNDLGNSEDIDVFAFRLNEPTIVYLEVLVPVCQGYEDFLPWFALAGPGLPEPKVPMPFDIPPGYGIEVIKNLTIGEPRDTFYEFFGGKSYYKGPVFDEKLTIPGTYYVYFWDPHQKGGDYVVVLGKKEIWRFQDIIQALRNTPLIRLGKELHVDCQKPQS